MGAACVGGEDVGVVGEDVGGVGEDVGVVGLCARLAQGGGAGDANIVSGLSVWSVCLVCRVCCVCADPIKRPCQSPGPGPARLPGLPARTATTSHHAPPASLPPCLPASLRDDHGNNIIDSFHRNSIQFNSIQFNSKFNSIQFNSIQNIMANLA